MAPNFCPVWNQFHIEKKTEKPAVSFQTNSPRHVEAFGAEEGFGRVSAAGDRGTRDAKLQKLRDSSGGGTRSSHDTCCRFKTIATTSHMEKKREKMGKKGKIEKLEI